MPVDAMEQQAPGCVMFADVSGSTKLYESAGDRAAFAAISGCVQLFKDEVAHEGGRVIKTIGDEVMAVFPDANGAARAALGMQRGVDAMPEVAGGKLGCRIGFHGGSLIHRDGDVFGDVVNLAARLASLASRGQIITSFDDVDTLEPMLKLDCRKLYALAVKGKDKEVTLCEMLWADTEDSTRMASRVVSTVARSLRIVSGDREVVMPAERKSLVLGRDATADLVIPNSMASRAHCEIKQRADKFVLADRSANGTYVTVDGDSEIVLRREEFMLRGHGWIVLGQSRQSAAEAVRFFCE
jgi:adenylate cyclase